MFKKRLFGVMAVLVVLMLALGLAACSSDDDGGGGPSDGPGGRPSGGGDIPADYTHGWPSDNTLAKYGLGGLPKWSGAGDSWYGTEKEDDVEVIAIVFEASSDPTSFYRNWFISNGFEEFSYGGTVSFVSDTGAVGTVYYEKSEGYGYVGGGIVLF